MIPNMKGKITLIATLDWADIQSNPEKSSEKSLKTTELSLQYLLPLEEKTHAVCASRTQDTIYLILKENILREHSKAGRNIDHLCCRY